MVRFPVSRHPIITLTTDFGVRDGYVAAMKGVVLSITPQAVLVDVTHEIGPQDILEASHVLTSVVPYFPSDAVHVVVVDPGVGTSRKPIAVRTPAGTLVAPDNGVVSGVLHELGIVDVMSGEVTGAEVVELQNPRYRRATVSATFHGRDIFAPAAAYLAAGIDFKQLGPPIRSVVVDTSMSPTVTGGAIHGRVMHIDRFGNAITNLRGTDVSRHARIEVAGRTIEGISRAYQDADVLALIGSTGYLEIAVREDSAERALHLHRGDEVIVR